VTLYIYIHTRIFKSNVRRTLTLSLSPTYPITREPVPFYKQASASFHTITNNSRVSGLRIIFGGKKAGEFGLHVCQIRTRAIFYLQQILKEKIYRAFHNVLRDYKNLL